jgi:hypothetical protein
MTFFDEYLGTGFYRELDLNYRKAFLFGQFYRTHAYYPHQNLQLWRPIKYEGPSSTIATQFQIQSAGADAFKHNLPLGSPKLESNEEFLVIRAKVRPVLLLQPENPGLANINKGYPAKLQRRLCSVAQIFSVADQDTGTQKFNPDFLDRVRLLEYPEFMFLPRKTGLLEVDSLLRLDEVQSVFTSHLQPLQYAFSDEAAEILRDQLQLWLIGRTRPYFDELRNALLAD